MDMQELSPLIDDLFSSIQDTMNISSLPAVTLHDDPQNSKDILGKTAHYDPQNKVITVYVTNRHPKDIMRSLAHEMIHHSQNERGEFDNIGNVGEGYAQSDDHLRNMEKEAYLKGNMCFRDWEDGYKNKLMESIHRQNSFKRRNNTMKIHKWKNNELNRLLMEKFGFGEGKPADDELSKKQEIVAETSEQEQVAAGARDLQERCNEGDKDACFQLEQLMQQFQGLRYMMEGEKPPFDDKDGKDEKCDYVDCKDVNEEKKVRHHKGFPLEPCETPEEFEKKAKEEEKKRKERARNKGKRMAGQSTNESFRKEIRAMMEQIINK